MRSLAALGIVFFIVTSMPLQAAMSLDLQTVRGIRPGDKSASYRVVFGSCSSLVRFEYGDGKAFQSVDLTSLQQEEAGACSYTFALQGDQVLSPSIRYVTLENPEFTTYSETFAYESLPPQIKLQNIQFGTGSDGQFLVLQVNAQDNLDISEVRYSVLGLLASDLRKAGGIIAAAAPQAFSTSGGWKVVHPVADSQTQIMIRVPLKSSLSQEQLA
ncbi:MAG TPA: hypothetical protein VE954_14730, partial [Oligoflexus sp.]|uniref:hypothetical protein n=1 Tax=Oligoflexus sp. TaxID=1971216 RepID=UPI002D341975